VVDGSKYKQEYEAIYKANVAHAAFPPAQRSVVRRKRSEDDEDDERCALPVLRDVSYTEGHITEWMIGNDL